MIPRLLFGPFPMSSLIHSFTLPPLSVSPCILTDTQVCQLANALKRQGVKQGDCVAIYMPTCPDAVYAMLACARIGAVHTVIFGGFRYVSGIIPIPALSSSTLPKLLHFSLPTLLGCINVSFLAIV